MVPFISYGHHNAPSAANGSDIAYSCARIASDAKIPHVFLVGHDAEVGFPVVGGVSIDVVNEPICVSAVIELPSNPVNVDQTIPYVGSQVPVPLFGSLNGADLTGGSIDLAQ